MTDALTVPNNTRIKCNGMIVYDIELVDEAQQLYRGKRLATIGTPQDSMPVVYFTMRYDLDNNDSDRMLNPIFRFDDSLLGVDFLLVPTAKILLGVEPAPGAGLVLPPVTLKAGTPFAGGI
jgi:hypothetical protein